MPQRSRAAGPGPVTAPARPPPCRGARGAGTPARQAAPAPAAPAAPAAACGRPPDPRTAPPQRLREPGTGSELSSNSQEDPIRGGARASAGLGFPYPGAGMRGSRRTCRPARAAPRWRHHPAGVDDEPAPGGLPPLDGSPMERAQRAVRPSLQRSARSRGTTRKRLQNVVPALGLEPRTHGLRIRCSNQLS